MFQISLIVASVAIGSLALPFGLLPSILGFRDLANGLDGSEGTKRAYAITLWGGLLAAWIAGGITSFVTLNALFG